MSVGKESIRRAASAGAKRTAKTTAKASDAAAVKSTAKTTTKTAAKTTVKVTSEKKTVKKSVVSPQDAKKLEAVFVTENKNENAEGPVRIKEELPVYLL